MKQITLGDIARAYWTVLNCNYTDPAFQYYEMAPVLSEIKKLREDETIDKFFAEQTREAFFAKWDKVVFDVEG